MALDQPARFFDRRPLEIEPNRGAVEKNHPAGLGYRVLGSNKTLPLLKWNRNAEGPDIHRAEGLRTPVCARKKHCREETRFPTEHGESRRYSRRRERGRPGRAMY